MLRRRLAVGFRREAGGVLKRVLRRGSTKGF